MCGQARKGKSRRRYSAGIIALRPDRDGHISGYEGLEAMGNAFGQHEFEKLSNEKVGDFKIAAGQSATFRYRFYLHNGTAEEAKVAERFEEFVNGVKWGDVKPVKE